MNLLKKLLVTIILTGTILFAVSPILFTGCGTTADRTAYNSLATTGATVNAAYSAYLSSVLQGQVPTNDVPKISAQYRQFKVLYDAACVAASFATNFTTAPPEVIAAGGAVTSSIAAVKGVTK